MDAHVRTHACSDMCTLMDDLLGNIGWGPQKGDRDDDGERRGEYRDVEPARDQDVDAQQHFGDESRQRQISAGICKL